MVIGTAGAQSTFNADLGVDVSSVGSRWNFATATPTGETTATSWNAAAAGLTSVTDTNGLAAYIVKGINKTFTDSVK